MAVSSDTHRSQRQISKQSAAGNKNKGTLAKIGVINPRAISLCPGKTSQNNYFLPLKQHLYFAIQHIMKEFSVRSM